MHLKLHIATSYAIGTLIIMPLSSLMYSYIALLLRSDVIACASGSGTCILMICLPNERLMVPDVDCCSLLWCGCSCCRIALAAALIKDIPLLVELRPTHTCCRQSKAWQQLRCM